MFRCSLFRFLKRKLLPAGICSFTAAFSFVPFVRFSPLINDLRPETLTPTVNNSIFETKENKREQLYGNHNVLVFVPHPDDDINLMAGILDSYVDAGSTVRVVFVTNGDYYGYEYGAKRYEEAINALNLCGIKEENIIFLGFGDQWKDKHIYDAAPDEIVLSKADYSKTRGTPFHPAFIENMEYTRNNLKSCMRSVIQLYNPDTLFCVDMDGHKDHRAVSLLFDETLGEILRDTGIYRPTVYKGFAYLTSWYAPMDFYAENLLSTQNPDELPYISNDSCLEWDNRVRFPISAKSLSRFSYNTLTHNMLASHISQNALRKESAILSGDRVFFERYTSSILYTADIQTSSNADKSTLLNNFKFLDTENVSDRYCQIRNNVWFPAGYDQQKTIRIKLDEAKPIQEIRLYDNPDTESNILDCLIKFSNGTVIHSGKLKPNGSATIIHPKLDNSVDSFEIKILDSEGDEAGFCEIEAYETNPCPSETRLIKLKDMNDNFIYDYWLQQYDQALFSVYAYPSVPNSNDIECYIDSRSSDLCTADYTGGIVHVICPKGCNLVITLQSKSNPNLYDTVKINNPSTGRRELIDEMQLAEYYRNAG